MTLLDGLWLVSALTALGAGLFGRSPATGPWLTVLYGVQFLLVALMGSLAYGAAPVPASVTFDILGQALSWRFTSLSWFFALITAGASLTAAWFMGGAWARAYEQRGGDLRLLQLALALNPVTMYVLLASGDFLSLFVGWELVSWASFLLMLSAGGVGVRWAMRYLVYAIGGAMAVMGAMVQAYAVTGSFAFGALAAAAPNLSAGALWSLVILLAGGFGVKMGLLPFHLWQAGAYAETPGPGSAFLGAISSRMGLFAMLLTLWGVLGFAVLQGLHVPWTPLEANELLAWVAAFTLVFPTFTALRQNDARWLLAWHGIGQGGYMLMGVAMGDALASAGGLMHVFNHATYQAALFMAVTAVVYRTGTADLNKLGGLVTRMPLSFLVLLVGIIGLAGLPPMNGFVSKWLIYRALIDEGQPLLFVAAVVGTLGTIVSVYKLLHNIFLGQLRVEHETVREVPWSMLSPMLVLSVVVFVTGLAPGLVLDWVASAQRELGLPVLVPTLGGVARPDGGLDMLWVVGLLFAGFGVGALIFLAGGRARTVHQLDNYAGGHFLSADVRYHYSDNFYAGLMHKIGTWYRGSFRWLQDAVVAATDFLAQGAVGIYRSIQPTAWLLGVAVLALWWVTA